MSATLVSAPSVRVRLLHRIPAVWLQPLALVGTTLIGIWLLVAMLGPWLAPYDPLAHAALGALPPTTQHPFGTDDLGRDVLSRVLSGASGSILLALVPVYLALLIGGALGALAGYVGGWLERAVIGVADLVVAIPAIVLAMAVVVALGPGPIHAMTAIVVILAPGHIRLARDLVRTTLQSAYVGVAGLLGVSAGRALIVDVLPNVAGPLVVVVVLDLGTAILLLAGLSFLGLGSPPPAPEWGAMVAGGAQHIDNWWIGVFPGLAIASIVVAFNFLGDSLRDTFDPQALVSRTQRG